MALAASMHNGRRFELDPQGTRQNASCFVQPAGSVDCLLYALVAVEAKSAKSGKYPDHVFPLANGHNLLSEEHPDTVRRKVILELLINTVLQPLLDTSGLKSPAVLALPSNSACLHAQATSGHADDGLHSDSESVVADNDTLDLVSVTSSDFDDLDDFGVNIDSKASSTGCAKSCFDVSGDNSDQDSDLSDASPINSWAVDTALINVKRCVPVQPQLEWLGSVFVHATGSVLLPRSRAVLYWPGGT
ncbi:hypothetical protein BCR44DRAFT_312456 [Catenaria anguillulae PL171]|uniref:Uncharacterized protein n=1 Tax=Catenaria anguillulae PL171 TaxID=765915 RepID=A0A1Y2HE10_9FUNG|nr:hypothetical protein BCR44DRAFT_312456 [Catenaria anguillulae PL171]